MTIESGALGGVLGINHRTADPLTLNLHNTAQIFLSESIAIPIGVKLLDGTEKRSLDGIQGFR